MLEENSLLRLVFCLSEFCLCVIMWQINQCIVINLLQIDLQCCFNFLHLKWGWFFEWPFTKVWRSLKNRTWPGRETPQHCSNWFYWNHHPNQIRMYKLTLPGNKSSDMALSMYKNSYKTERKYKKNSQTNSKQTFVDFKNNKWNLTDFYRTIQFSACWKWWRPLYFTSCPAS